MSIMHVSSGLAHMLVSNHRGLGHEPVTVLGMTRSFVAVNGMGQSLIPKLIPKIPKLIAESLNRNR